MPFMFPILLPFPSPQTYHWSHNLESFANKTTSHTIVMSFIYFTLTTHFILIPNTLLLCFIFNRRGVKMFKKRNITVATRNRVVQARSFTEAVRTMPSPELPAATDAGFRRRSDSKPSCHHCSRLRCLKV